MLRRNGQNHAFLCFRKPDLPGSQALIFQGSVCQFDMRAGVSAHLADSGREAASSTIGNGVVQFAVACLDDDIGDFLLGNGSADLYGCTGLCVDLAAHLARREGCAMYAIASLASAEYYNMVVWLDGIGVA